MTTAADNAALARRFIAALEAGTTGDALAAFFHDDVEQHELPNRLVAEGARRDRAALLSSAEKGQKVLRSQRYEVLNVVAEGDHVAVEMRWRGELAIPLGALKPGDTIGGQFAFFLEVREGRIHRIRNYDCYDPF
ncbi:MAG TPA: nuclear transport factor 2 family protein [Labilithrix sp.]|nr:nuclear transport factor 2 family protein [Labilithrix sp.]